MTTAPHTTASGAADATSAAELALRKVLAAVQRYLPPDGPSVDVTMNEIIEIVDPWPLDGIQAMQTRDVWVAWTNTDLTEGRGYRYPLAVCESETTADRLGQKKYVMGSACPVTKEVAVRVHGSGWLVPGAIHPETDEDKKARAILEARRAAVQKAKDAGLTDEEITALGARQ